MINLPSYSHRFDIELKHDYMQEYQNIESEFNYRRMLGWMDCEHLQAEDKRIERENMIREFGANSAIVRSMLYGLFQRSEDFNLIYTDDDLELMTAAMNGDNKGHTIGTDVEAAGDVSGGGDEQILMIRIGTDIVGQDYQQHIKDPSASVQARDLDQADYWVDKLRMLDLDPWQFRVDGGGLGATVANYMETRLFYTGIKRAQANMGPRYKSEYRDKYTETHFKLKELLSAGVLSFYSYDEVLLKQMRCRRFIEMEGGEKLKIEAKPLHRKREGTSPDRLDTLVYLFYDFDWSLLENYSVDVHVPVDPNAPTKMELRAQGGGRRPLAVGMPSMNALRQRVENDRRMYNFIAKG